VSVESVLFIPYQNMTALLHGLLTLQYPVTCGTGVKNKGCTLCSMYVCTCRQYCLYLVCSTPLHIVSASSRKSYKWGYPPKNTWQKT